MKFQECSLIELMSHYSIREGFHFYSITEPTNVRDAIVIHVSKDAEIEAPTIPPSLKSLDEHIAFINEHKLEKALVIGDRIDFLLQCPSLHYLWIIPSFGALNGFDFSPLYMMPEIKFLKCATKYGQEEKNGGYLDYSKIRGLQMLNVDFSKYDQHFEKVSTLKTLELCHYKTRNGSLRDAFSSSILDVLRLSFCGLSSLDGIEIANSMKSVELLHCRKLEDISALAKVKNSLVSLNIRNCPQIRDFSVLGQLHELEDLRLEGKNILSNLSFLRCMPSLKVFVLSMDVADGDLSPCLNIPFVHCDDKKHFSHKNVELPKNTGPDSNFYARHGIEEWRS